MANTTNTTRPAAYIVQCGDAVDRLAIVLDEDPVHREEWEPEQASSKSHQHQQVNHVLPEHFHDHRTGVQQRGSSRPEGVNVGGCFAQLADHSKHGHGQEYSVGDE